MTQNTILMGSWGAAMYANQLCLHGRGIVRSCEPLPGVICGPNSVCHVLVTGVSIPAVVASKGGKPLPPVFLDIAKRFAVDIINTNPSFLTCRITNTAGLKMMREVSEKFHKETRGGRMEEDTSEYYTMERQYEFTVIPSNLFGEMMDPTNEFQYDQITFKGGLQKQRASDGHAMFVVAYKDIHLVKNDIDDIENNAARALFDGESQGFGESIQPTTDLDGERVWDAIEQTAKRQTSLLGWKLEWHETFDAKALFYQKYPDSPRITLPTQSSNNCFIHVYEWAQDEEDSNVQLGLGITEFQTGAMIKIKKQGGAPLRPCRIRIDREPDVSYSRYEEDYILYMYQYDMNSVKDLNIVPGYVKPGVWVSDLLMGDHITEYEED